MTTLSMIGTQTNWNGDIDLTLISPGIYKLTYNLISGNAFKFRVNHDWGVNYGTDVAGSLNRAGILVLPGDATTNILNPPVTGMYDIMANLNTLTFSITDPVIVCFKEDTKILTDKGYVLIQDLRKGDLVKTLLHGFKPIDMIGKRQMLHTASKERIKDQLYECSPSKYPELFEPLIITGCHSILVEDLTGKEQRDQIIEVLGKIYETDDKYRLPACVDERTTVYETVGLCTIYHIALENDNYYWNYGIYANGLLVETCSKRYLKELSNMSFI
jgi:hypothetical protein